MATKGIIRSMRFSDEIVKLIEEQPGDTFTAKFDSLIYRCVHELPEKQRRVMLIQDLIEQESRRLDRIRKLAYDLEMNISSLSNNLLYFSRQTQQVVNSIDRLVDDSNTKSLPEDLRSDSPAN